jgi:hypothetical protein
MVGENPQGFETYFGNLTFTGVSIKFKPVHLIIHEVEHCINWRYWIGTQLGECLFQADTQFLRLSRLRGSINVN